MASVIRAPCKNKEKLVLAKKKIEWIIWEPAKEIQGMTIPLG